MEEQQQEVPTVPRKIFLDFDGVITTNTSYHRADAVSGGRLVLSPDELFRVIDPVLVARVGRFAQLAQAKIVLSTAWRESFGMGRIIRELQARGMPEDVPIIGKTPSWRARKMSERLPSNYRGIEIQRYLEENHVDPQHVVILDDADCSPLQERQVLCFFDGGTEVEGFIPFQLRKGLKLFGLDIEYREEGEEDPEDLLFRQDEVSDGRG